MRVALYARVSTKEQSNELQLTELRQFAKQRGFLVHDIYVDVITGDMDKRKNVYVRYNDLLKDAKDKKFDAILVWKFDRLARTLMELCAAMNLFRELGVHFISATQAIDTTGPMGKMMYQLLAMFAEFEREMISERMRAGRRYVQEHGKNTKGEPSSLGRPEKVTEEQKQSILRRFAANEKLSAIAVAESMPLPTIYSIIKRTVVPCQHGKYRCKDCRKSSGISLRSASPSDERVVGSRASKILGHERVSTSHRSPQAMRSDAEGILFTHPDKN